MSPAAGRLVEPAGHLVELATWSSAKNARLF
jgi:hypothetical protein